MDHQDPLDELGDGVMRPKGKEFIQALVQGSNILPEFWRKAHNSFD